MTSARASPCPCNSKNIQIIAVTVHKELGLAWSGFVSTMAGPLPWGLARVLSGTNTKSTWKYPAHSSSQSCGNRNPAVLVAVLIKCLLMQEGMLATCPRGFLWCQHGWVPCLGSPSAWGQGSWHFGTQLCSGGCAAAANKTEGMDLGMSE